MNNIVSAIKGGTVGFESRGVFIGWFLAQVLIIAVVIAIKVYFRNDVPVESLIQTKKLLWVLGLLSISTFGLWRVEKSAYVKKYGWR